MAAAGGTRGREAGGWWWTLLAALLSAVRQLTRPEPPGPRPAQSPRSAPSGPRTAPGPRQARHAPGPKTAPGPGPGSGGYAGDATGAVTLEYSPFDDGQPDPGEIVWAWVPYEEDHSQGKDRPVLVVGRQQGLLLALMLTSKDHDRDEADEARHGRHWVDIGSGGWDPRRRPSEVRVDRVLRIDPARVRREGAVLDEQRFRRVADAVRRVRPGAGSPGVPGSGS